MQRVVIITMLDSLDLRKPHSAGEKLRRMTGVCTSFHRADGSAIPFKITEYFAQVGRTKFYRQNGRDTYTLIEFDNKQINLFDEVEIGPEDITARWTSSLADLSHFKAGVHGRREIIVPTHDLHRVPFNGKYADAMKATRDLPIYSQRPGRKPAVQPERDRYFTYLDNPGNGKPGLYQFTSEGFFGPVRVYKGMVLVPVGKLSKPADTNGSLSWTVADPSVIMDGFKDIDGDEVGSNLTVVHSDIRVSSVVELST